MTIFYTIVKENKTNKIISGEFSPQSSNLNISKEILKELRDIKEIKKISKIESSFNGKYLYFIYPNDKYIYSVIVDQYEDDQNVLNYLQDLNKLLLEKKYKIYEFYNVIKEKSNEYNKDKTLKEIDETKNVLADSLNLIIQRRENINNISKLADRLTFETREMHTSIKNIQFNNLAKKYGTYAICLFIFILALYYVIH